MLYNKRTHQKINDKKILRRVNSQWVVVSVATLLLAGAIGLTQVSQVSADTNQVGNQAESVSGTAVLTPPTGGNSYTVADANNYSDQIQQGYLDGYQGKSNQSQTLSGRGADYYNVAYAGAQKTLQAYNSATQGQGAGNQDYYFYGNTAKKADGFSNDNKDAQTGIDGSDQPNSDADKASEQGTQVSNVQGDNSTHFNSVLTDGTPQNYGASDDVNQGGADTPKEAKASVKKYESTLVNLFNSSNNTSIKVSDYNQTITIPTSTDSIIASYRNGLVGSGLQKAFESAVNYTLGQLGQRDAETGKWQGVYHGSNGQTKDFYLSSNTAKVTSPYDQAYRGAKSAMNRYFTNNIYNGNTAVAQSDTGNFYYDQGFNDIVTQASNGVVYVANGQQWSSIMTGQIQPYTVGGYVAGNINTVKLVNDIDLTGATNGENDGTIYTNMSVLTVDGQHHMMDFHGNNYTVNRLGPGALDLYVQNFQTLYGSNYFGPFRAEAGASLHFSNLNYVGPQLLSSYNNDSYASGNINVVTPTSSDATYTSPFQTKVYMEGGGNQQNLEVNNFILETNAHFFGNASPVRGGINVVVQGNFTIGENAKMTLIPRGFSNSEFTVDSSTWGVWLRNTGSSLNINKNATLNIIPDNFQGDKYIFGGAVYKAYAIQININGGTLNYEAQGGLAGYYNQPIDLQGGSGTQISVTNGGLMQVMMDQVPDGQGVYSYTRNGHQATWNALINNVGQGIFNVGARGNLKVGVTNSDTSYIVPYYGPISINTIGSNHAIFIKTPTVSQFQTTSSGQGLAGSGTAGNINAYTVAVYDGTRKRYLYNFSLASGSNQYTGIDLQGNQISGTISGNTLEIFDVPSVSFVGNLSKTIDADGTATITGYARLANYEELDNNPEPIYVGIATSTTDPQGNYNNLTQVSGSTIVNKNSIADPNTYVSQIVTPADYKGGIIPITFKLAKGQNPAYIGMRLHYGVSAVNSILTPDKYYTTVEGYQQGQNGKVLEVVNGGDMQVATGSLADISTGLKDAIVDSITGSSASRDQQSFNQKANADYLAAYASVQSGFSAYKANPDKDPTTIPAYYSSSNPAAFVLGFNEAAYQTGVQDARFNVTNVVADKSQKYQEAQDYYKKAYQETQLSVNQGKNTSQIQSKYPSTNSNSTPDVPIANTAAYQGISDAQALVAFFSDTQSGKISSGQFNTLTKEQQAVYNDAKIGFQNALMVDRYAVNPDMNANKVEQDAFDYVQSMINGALSQNKPVTVDTSNHLKNLEAAQIGWQLAQDAVASARTNGIDSVEAQLLDPSQLNSDKSINATVYQYLKFGAYAGLQGKTDTLLNTLEKVGYNQVIIPVAKQEGINAVNQLTGSKAISGVAAASQTGLAAFGQGYADAIASYKYGYNAGLNEAQKHGLVSDQPTIPNNVTDQLKSAYLAGYHGAVDGYKDGQAKNDQHRDKNGSPLYQDAYQKSYASSANLDEKTSNSNQNNNNSSNNDNNQESNEIVPDGAKLFLNNEPAPSGNSEENQNIRKNYNATQQGFVDILSGNKTDASNYTADQKSAYDSGKKAANDVLMVWKSAMLSGQQVLPVQGIPALTSATNDAFNATVAQVEGIGYLISDKPMNQIILSTLGKGGISNYNNGVLQSLMNPQAMGEDFFTQAGIKDVNDGYRGNAQTGNVSSNGYLQGLELKENEATGIDQANNDATVTMSDPTAQDALLGTKDAYNDVFNRGGSQDVSHRSRAYQDAYLQAVNSATNLNLIPSILNSVTNRAGNPFLKNSAQSLASSQVFTNAQNGFDDALNGGVKAEPSSQDKSYLTGFNAGLKVQSDYQRAWSEQLPKVNSQDSDTYNGAAAAIIAVYQYGTKSHIGVDEIHNGAYVAAYNLAVDQANANKQIDQAVSDTKSKINQDPTLTTQEKATQLANVNKAASEAKAAIANGSDQIVADAVSRAQGTIASNYIAGKPLPDRQQDAEKDLQATAETAKHNLDDQVAQANNDVNNNHYLTDDEKAAQKQAIQNAANAILAKISNATNADAVNDILNNGKNVVGNLNGQKLDARTTINNAVQEAKAKIDNNNALTADEKTKRVSQIKAAQTAANQAVDAATDADAIAKILANGSDFDKSIKSATDFSNVTSLNDQQANAGVATTNAGQTAKDKLDAAKTASENAINQDGSLTFEQKAMQKKAIDAAVTNAKSSIASTTNADDVAKARDVAVAAILKMTSDKANARQSLAKNAQDAIDKINQYEALTSGEKASRIQQIQDAYDKATTVVDDATDSQYIASVKNTTGFADTIAKATDLSNIQSLADQKTTAGKEVDDATVAIKANIDADTNLSSEDKTAQKATIDVVAASKKSAINSATNADGVATAKNVAVQIINGLDKTNADKIVSDQASSTHATINDNPALTKAQKDAFKKQIDDAKQTAQNNVNNATDSSTVASLVDSQNSNYAKQLQNVLAQAGQVPSIQAQQTAANKAIDAANAVAKAKVDADPSNTDADNQAQKDALDAVANQAKTAIQQAATADDINQAQANGTNALSNMDKTANDKSVAKQAADAHAAVNNNLALTQAQKDGFSKQIDDAKKAAQDLVNKATNPTTASAAVDTLNSDYAKQLATIAQQVSAIPSLDSQKATANQAIQQAAAQAKQTIDVDKTLTGAQKNDQKAAIDAIVKSATDAINQAMDADSINKIQINMTDALNNIHDQKADALSKLQKQADDANHAIDANNALTADQQQAAHEAVVKALTNAQAVTDHTTNAEDVANSGNQAAYNKALQDIADGLAKVPSLVDQVHAAIEKLTETVNKAKDALSRPDADAQKKALDKVLSDGTAKLNAQTNADDLKKTLVDVLNTVNGLNQSKTDALTDLDAQAKKATDTINAAPSFTDDEKATRVAAVAKALQDAHDAINEAIDLPGVDAARKATAFSETLNDATSDVGVQTLADRKTDAKKTLQDAADKTKSAIAADKTLTGAQKTAQKQAINQLLKIAQNQVDAATTATKVDVSKATNLPTFDALNKTKSDAHQTEDKTYNDAKKAIQNNNDLTDVEKQVRISDLDKAHQLASDAIDQAVTPDEIKTANETTTFDNAVKSATDFSKVTPLAERKQAGIMTLNTATQKAVDEVNTDTKLDADAKARQIVVLKQKAQDAITKLNNQTDAQGVVDFIPTVVPTFEKLNQSKVDARARLQNNAATTKAAIDADDNLSNAQKQDQKDGVDAAWKQAVIDADNGQDVLTINSIPDGSTAVKKINQGHVRATKTPAQQEEELNAQIDDQAAKVKGEIDADVTLRDAEKSAQKHTIDSFVAEAKAKIAVLTKYQDRLDVVNQALDLLKNLHQQGKPLTEQKSDAITTIDQMAYQIRTQIANDSRLTKAQKDADYQLVEGAVAKAKSQVNAALNADEIVAGLDYGTVQLEAAYQQKVQEQYDEKQSTTPETISVLPQTGETEKKHEEALVAEALVDSMAGFFLSKMNRRRQCEK